MALGWGLALGFLEAWRLLLPHLLLGGTTLLPDSVLGLTSSWISGSPASPTMSIILSLCLFSE